MKKGSKRVIPGFGLSMGVTLSILSIIVLIPLASLTSTPHSSARQSFSKR